jgi:DNA-directed RNA polymerase subunit RPC12/RpoP
MADGTVSYHCPNCGAPIYYKSEPAKFICDYCGSDFTVEEMDAYARKLEQRRSRKEERTEAIQQNRQDQANETVHSYHCQNCGAQVVTTETTSSTFCFYCHSPVVIESRLQGDFRPDQIMPFDISEEQAKKDFIAWAKSKKYLPDDFLSEAHLDKMTGMYIPYWYGDAEVNVHFEGNSSASQSWQQNNYRYTRTVDKHHVRQGHLSITDLSLQAFSKIDPNLLNGIEPFDSDAFIDFSIPLLQGYFAEQYTMPRDQAMQQMDREVDGASRALLRQSIEAANVQVDYEDYSGEKSDLRFSLLPVWVLTYNYKGKIYVYAMNGQSGRTFGEVPIVESKLKSDARKRGLIFGLIASAVVTALASFFFIF